jgi:hypothetical protein
MVHPETLQRRPMNIVTIFPAADFRNLHGLWLARPAIVFPLKRVEEERDVLYARLHVSLKTTSNRKAYTLELLEAFFDLAQKLHHGQSSTIGSSSSINRLSSTAVSNNLVVGGRM